MKMSYIKSLTAGSLLLLAVVFVLLTVVSNSLLRGVRLDLTEDGQYTLSEGTKSVLASIDEPINLYFFYSDKAASDVPYIRSYATRVRELLEEYQGLAGGKLNLEVIDPISFSEAEEQASQFGLQGVPVGSSGDTIYLGLAGTNALDGEAAIPFFQPDKEAFLEYDVSKLVYSLINPQRPVVGLISELPIAGGFDQATRQRAEPWAIYTQIEQMFEVRSLDASSEVIGPDIDVLMLVHPKSLSDTTLYAIDQFVLRGGKLVVFVDPNAETDASAHDPNNPTAGLFADKSSDLKALFAAWGVKYDRSQVVADQGNALQVATQRGGEAVRHLGILSLPVGGMNQDEVISAQLESVNVSTIGGLGLADDAPVTMIPLLFSSDQAMPMGADKFRFLPDPNTLFREFTPTGETYWLAVMLRGDVETAFPAGPAGTTGSDHLGASQTAINVVVVADTDLLSDRLWVRTQSFFGQKLISAWANNGDFVFNGLDAMTGSSDLISIRARGSSQRPFTRVDTLKRAAEEKFRATEQQLQDQLQATEQKLTEMQSGKSQEGLLILNDEQQQALQRFQDEKARIRKQLRQVRHDLNSDIEQLGTDLKIINIALVPILLTIVLLIVSARRASGRRKS